MAIFDQIHKAGNTVIVVTHEKDIALHAKRIIRLIDGEVSTDEENHERTPVEFQVEGFEI